MQVKEISITKIKPYKKNAKKHPKEQIERIAESIKRFGFVQPVVLDENNVVIIGHGRCMAAKKAGLKVIPCVYAEGLTEAEIKALRLVDNKLNESDWDYSLLDAEIEELLPEVDMSLFGFEEEIDLTDAFEYKTKEKQERNFFTVTLAFPKDEKEIIMRYLNRNKEKVQEIIRRKAGVK